MTGLDLVTFDPILKDKYEVVIIGSGIGGLSAAAVLAHAGLDVIVLEKSHRPGGCCTSFKVNDFTFDIAVSTLNGLGEIGFHTLRSLFDFLRQQIDIIPCRSSHRVHFGDMTSELHQDTNALTSELGALFPSQAGSIIAMMRELEHIYLSVLDCEGPPRSRVDESFQQRWNTFSKHPVSVLRCSRYKGMSAKKVISKFISDPVALAFFEADLIFNTGYNLDQLSATHAALSIIDRQIGGTHYPIGSSQQIPDRLERNIIKNGGQVVFRTAVEEILVENSKATGVVLSGGRRIKADAVISDNSLLDLYGELIKPEHLKINTKRWAEMLRPSQGALALYLGVRDDVIPPNTNPNTLFIDDPERDPGGFISVNIPSMYDPNLAPPGYHSMTILATANQAAWNSPETPSYGTQPYKQFKREEAMKILDKLEDSFPKLKEGIVEKHTASPDTFEHYINRRNGAFAGPCADGILLPGNLPGNVTEINGLFHVGDSTLFGRSVAWVTASSLSCVVTAMKYLGKPAPKFSEEKNSFVLETVPVKPELFGEDVVDNVSAVLESNRCLRCKDAPCILGCPAGIDIPNFIRRINASDFIGAARTIREVIPIGGACGQLCPGEILCEATCRRGEIDRPIKIGQLGSLACTTAQDLEGWPQPPESREGGKVAVIGCGPAGLSCAYYLSLLGHSVHAFEATTQIGGLLTKAMAPFRLDHQLFYREIEKMISAGMNVHENSVFGQDLSFESLLRDGFDAIFIASGLQVIPKVELPGSDLPGVIDALSFLSAARRRVKRELAQKVAVLGDTNMAVDTTLLASELGAREIFLITDCTEEELKASPSRLAEARRKGIKILTERDVDHIAGEGRVENIITTPLSANNRNDKAVEFDIYKSIEVETVVVALPRKPDNSITEYLSEHLKMNSNGTVLVNKNTMMTSREGVFAGGDLTNGESYVVLACTDGRRAAASIDEFLKNGSS